MIRIIRLQVGLAVALVASVLTSTNSVSAVGAAEVPERAAIGRYLAHGVASRDADVVDQ